MHFTPESFRAWPTKRITLLGMSGVGKTHISSMLRGHDWFHFSGDYRIGTRYLDEPILDLIKQQAMQVPFLRDLLRRDWIDIKNNIKIHDLGAGAHLRRQARRAGMGRLAAGRVLAPPGRVP